MQKGPQIANAQVFDDGISPPGVIDDGISPPGVIDDGISPPGVIDDGITPPQSQPCPAQGCPGGNPPPPSCPQSREQYPQCGGTAGLQNFPATDTIMVTRVKDCRGNIIRYETQNLGNLGQCQQATTTPPPAPAPAPQPTAAPAAPTSVSAPGSPSISGSPFCEGNSPAITWNWSIPANAETFSVNLPGTSAANYPANSGYRSDTKRNLVSGQVHNASIIVSNSAGSNSATASVTAPDCGTSQTPSGGRPQCPSPGQSGTRLLCNQWAYDNCSVTERDSNGNATKYHCVFSGNDNCIGDLICTTQTSACTPSTSRESSCVGNQLCSFNNNRFSDCSTSRTGPFNCQLIAGQCGFNPGSTCTVATANQSICVNAQLCTVTLTRNTDCTISRSGPFNCQNSTQCGFSTPPAVGGTSAPVAPVVITVNNPPATVVQSFGNVGVGTTVYTQGVQYATTLPKTGLPLLAWAAGAFLPAGFGLRRVSRVKKELDSNPNYLWEDRQFKVGD